MLLDQFRGHLGVGKDPPGPGKAALLDLPGLGDPGPHSRGAFAPRIRGQFPEGHRGHLHLEVDAVQQRPGDAGAILLNLLGGAGAGPPSVAVIAAEAGIHRGHQHEAGREGDGAGGPGDGDHAVFQGLAQHLQGGALEFRQFVQEEDAVVGQAHLPRPGGGAAADEPGVGDGVVRRPERSPAQEPLAGLEQPHDAVNLGGLQGLFLVQGRQDGGNHLELM